MQVSHAYLQSILPDTHPFDRIASHKIRSTMEQYFAMSQAFPYLQSGSQKDIFFHYLNNNIQVDSELELTTVVGNFLSWDETGGLYVTLRKKMRGISDILNTDDNFHANLLKKDLSAIFGCQVSPDYSDMTKEYLINLYKSLSSIDHIERCASMVAFEVHAERMINSLWTSLDKIFDHFDKDDLTYFKSHVGGDDPAEAYHVKMTEELIERIANTDEKRSKFIDKFLQSYDLNSGWCAAISKSETEDVKPPSEEKYI